MPLRQRSFAVSIDENNTKITVQICEPEVRAQGLSLETWASSQVLANALHRLDISHDRDSQEQDSDKKNHSETQKEEAVLPVLELGAGTGLVGITAAVVWRTSVLLTDLPGIVPGLEANVAANKSLLSGVKPIKSIHGREDVVLCGALDWDRSESLTIYPAVHDGQSSTAAVNGDQSGNGNSFTKARIILAADTVYSEEHPALLCQTIKYWLEHHVSARVIIAWAMRVAYLDQIRELWQGLEDLGLECIHEEKGEADSKDFDDERLVEVSVWRWRMVV